MSWIDQYQLFLFDFDGVLVNSEELHYRAYQTMCQRRGRVLSWDMATYAQAAMRSATGVQEGIYREFPDLKTPWDVLYGEKRQAYSELLEAEGTPLMPGAKELLEALDKKGIKRCVVTHSPREHVERIKRLSPALQTIPHWITREDYSKPKPDGECYRLAIRRLKEPGERVIGFEDSPRGLHALLETEADAVFVSEMFTKEEVGASRPFQHLRSLPAP